MGVMGAGKTTTGKLLAEKLGCVFYDGNEFHPEENNEKMRNGIPLTDEDRKSWLYRLRAIIDRELGRNGTAVLECSALKEKYRKMLIGDRKEIKLIYLKGRREVIEERVKKRKKGIASAAILPGQFADLEEPGNAITVDVELSPEEKVGLILETLNSKL